MKAIGNVLWLVLCGAGLALQPFGKKVVRTADVATFYDPARA